MISHRLNRAFRILAVAIAGAASVAAIAQTDSVTSYGHRGTTGVNIAASIPATPFDPATMGTPGFSNLLTGQYAKSQDGTYPGYVGYGPYVNSSTAAVTITLVTPLGDNHAEMGGFVNDVLISQGQRSATFIVPPGATYRWYAKDGLIISASANQSGLTNASVGLPSASDYQTPKLVLGSYAYCVERWNSGGESGSDSYMYTTYYYTVSRSDKSSIGDGTTSGPAPPTPGTCSITYW